MPSSKTLIRWRSNGDSMGKLWVSAVPVVLLASILAGCAGPEPRVTWTDLEGAQEQAGGAAGPQVVRDTAQDAQETVEETVDEQTQTSAPPEPTQAPSSTQAPKPTSSCVSGIVDSDGAVLRQVSTPAATQYSKAGLAYDYQIKGTDIVDHGVAMVRGGDCVLPTSSQCAWHGVARPSAGTGMNRAVLSLALPEKAKDPDASGYPYTGFTYTLFAKTSGGQYYFTPWDTGSSYGKVGFYFHEKMNQLTPDVICDATAAGLL